MSDLLKIRSEPMMVSTFYKFDSHGDLVLPNTLDWYKAVIARWVNSPDQVTNVTVTHVQGSTYVITGAYGTPSGQSIPLIIIVNKA